MTPPALDELISKHAANWRLDRLAAIDRAILRLAMHEMRATDTPVKVVINEGRGSRQKIFPPNDGPAAFVKRQSSTPTKKP